MQFDQHFLMDQHLKKKFYVFLSVEEKRNFIANCIYNECSPSDITKQKTVTVRFSTTTNDAPTEQFDMSDFCVNVNHAILYAKFELSRRKHSTHSISFSSPLITTSLIPTNIFKFQNFHLKLVN